MTDILNFLFKNLSHKINTGISIPPNFKIMKPEIMNFLKAGASPRIMNFYSMMCILAAFIPMSASFVISPQSKIRRNTFIQARNCVSEEDGFEDNHIMITRRSALMLSIILAPLPVYAKASCGDIETCREIGERKVAQDLIENPRIKMKSGGMYKVLQPGTGDKTVGENSNLDIIYSVSTMSGGYMYSRGFGFEKIDVGNGQMVKDSGLDSIRVRIGEKDVPLGIEEALIGMKKNERRRVELPPKVGLVTSNGQPEPMTKRGKASMQGYQRMIEGTAGTPAFPAALIWDIEVLKIR